MRYQNALLLAGALGLVAVPVAESALVYPNYVPGGGITDSPHDLSYLDGTDGQICVVCHAPHNGASWNSGLLWNHALSSLTYTLYGTTYVNYLDGTVQQPLGSAKLCLSCHDGSVAIDQFGTHTGSTFITGYVTADYNPVIGEGGDLQGQHPISINYAWKPVCDPDVVGDCELNDPATVVTGTAAGVTLTVGDLLEVVDGTEYVQCASCHDVHNGPEVVDQLNPRLLRVAKDGSQICLACHKK